MKEKISNLHVIFRNPKSSILAVSVLLIVSFTTIINFGIFEAKANQNCPRESDYCVSDTFVEFWEANGSESYLGLPISEERTETIEGREYPVQWFERAKLEFHEENESPYKILLGRLGAEQFEESSNSVNNFTANRSDCISFTQTDQTVCGQFKQKYLEIGGYSDLSNENLQASIALVGLPISDQISQNQKTVQWFERARIEISQTGEIQLAQLGNESLGL
jgi:polysaccharide biosynthesis protein PslG